MEAHLRNQPRGRQPRLYVEGKGLVVTGRRYHRRLACGASWEVEVREVSIDRVTVRNTTDFRGDPITGSSTARAVWSMPPDFFLGCYTAGPLHVADGHATA